MNIVLNFSNMSVNNVVDQQPVAVMPAKLAKRLLKAYADTLFRASSYDIIREFKHSIDIHGTVADAVQTALEFIQERELISNIVVDNWDAYAVPVEDAASIADRETVSAYSA